MIVAGFGFRSSATVESFIDALVRAEGPAPDLLATLDGKAQTAAFSAFCLSQDLPLRAVTTGEAQRQNTQTGSKSSQAAYGVGSVAEACALAAAGPGARLLGPRAISGDRMATCALAETAR